MEAMGTRHDTSETTIILWRRQVVGGLPETVQQNLEDVLNLDTQTEPDWRRTVAQTSETGKNWGRWGQGSHPTATAAAVGWETRHNVNGNKENKPLKQMAAVSGLNVEIAEAVAQAMKTERDNQPPVTPQPPPPS